VPAGYVADQTGCASIALNGSCTVTNSLVAGAPHPAPTNSTWTLLLLAGLLVLLGGSAFRTATRKAKKGTG
jgi:hypothetical protein